MNTNSYKINTQVFPTFPFCNICKLVSSQVQEDNANLYFLFNSYERKHISKSSKKKKEKKKGELLMES